MMRRRKRHLCKVGGWFYFASVVVVVVVLIIRRENLMSFFRWFMRCFVLLLVDIRLHHWIDVMVVRIRNGGDPRKKRFFLTIHSKCQKIGFENS